MGRHGVHALVFKPVGIARWQHTSRHALHDSYLAGRVRALFQKWGCCFVRFCAAMCRQCSSGLQAIASVAASIQAGYYDIGLAGGVESMSTNPMAWDGGVNPKIAENQKAQDCLLPMGEHSFWLMLNWIDCLNPFIGSEA